MDIETLLEEKINDLRNIYDRISNISKDYPRLKNKQDVIYRKFFHELDYCINRAEDIYYRQVLKNKDITKITNDMDREIKMNRKVMDAMFPFLIMANMLENGQNHGNGDGDGS
jgi:ribosome-binding ATPase YchF (GTP1/OBG family)